MKQIVVGIDFSTNSIHALKFAGVFASKCNADIHMIWVDSSIVAADDIYVNEKNEDRAEAKVKLEELTKEYRAIESVGTVQYKLLKGKVYTEITRYAQAISADCIIVGTQGVNSYEENWVGSNANRVVLHARCPVITLRGDFNIESPLSTILIPIDNKSDSIRKMPFTSELASIFQSKVLLLGIYTTKLETMHKKVNRLLSESESILQEKHISYEKHIITVDNMAKEILSYSQSSKADLISILSERKTMTGDILLGDYAHTVVNHSLIPVLSVSE